VDNALKTATNLLQQDLPHCTGRKILAALWAARAVVKHPVALCVPDKVEISLWKLENRREMRRPTVIRREFIYNCPQDCMRLHKLGLK
jgi:hypothetical protein